MLTRTAVYWISQIAGWGLFVLGNILNDYFERSDGLSPVTYIASACIFIFGITITHVFRIGIHRWSWKKINIPALIPRMIMASVVMSLVFTSISTVITDLAFGNAPFERFEWLRFTNLVVNMSALFLLWSILYFAIANFENWKNEQIKNLELRAAKTEIELNSFKSQINPHFMFNSLNSVRALIDENPGKAKDAVTMLSGILRNNLIPGKKQEVPLKEELDLIDKYLSLEKIRFEERLNIEYQIEPSTLSCEIPPFMLQTIVENGIKHGISKRKAGGYIRLSTFEKNGELLITVTNSGHIANGTENPGIGLANTVKRLELLYGDKAGFMLENGTDEVIATLIIPQNHKHAAENTDR